MDSVQPPPHSGVPSSQRATSLLLGLLGAALAGLSVWGLVHDVVWVSQAFYAYVWWAWILFLDAFSVWRRGSSLLTTRRYLLGLLATSSVTFWFFFEALNLRFHNWYYVGTIELRGPLTYLGAGVFVTVAFSTVFIGLFEAFDALGAAKLFTRRRAPRRLPSWLPGAFQVLGLVMLVLAVAFPFYLAPLVWGSLTFLIDPWNYRRGNRSLLRDVETGDGGAVLRLFFAGLLCGLVWESLNFIAPQKWIYTVRGLENLKLFEMPLLGFLGFPALAFDAVTAFSCLSYWLCGNLTWEHPDDLVALPSRSSTLDLQRFWRTLPLQVLFWVAVTIALLPRSIGSVRLQLDRMPALEGSLDALGDLDLLWPRQLLSALAKEPGGTNLCAKLDWTKSQRSEIQQQLELYLFKGIGSTYGRLLEVTGVHCIGDLCHWTPTQLHAALAQEARKFNVPAPRLDWVRVWVLASRSRGALLQG